MVMLLACASQWAAVGAGVLTIAGVVALIAFLRIIDKIGSELQRLDRQSKGR